MDCDSCGDNTGNNFITDFTTAYLRNHSGTGMLFCVFCRLIS